MPSMLDTLMSRLDTNAMATLGRQAGTDPAATQGAVSVALPLLLAALARNSSSPSGAGALRGALERHDGGLLEDLAGALGSAATGTDGAAILGHVFGNQRETIEDGISQAAGVSRGQGAQILALLAPMVLAYLGKKARQKNLDADGLGGVLAGETDTIRKRTATQRSLLESILDRNGDGSIIDDVGRIGLGMAGGLFKTERS